MLRAAARIFVSLMVLTLAGSAAMAAKRVALVIGNSAYTNAPALTNPKNDAEDMAAALKALGFTVILGTDLDKRTMDRKILEFSNALSGADAGVFHYSGHGLQVAGVNYLVPVDAALDSAASLDFEAVRLDLVQRTMEREAKTNILFLDACRNNPLSRNLARALGTRSADIGHGLAPAESGVGTLISFSTQPGNVALDGSGRNSPYSGPLAKAIGTPGEDISRSSRRSATRCSPRPARSRCRGRTMRCGRGSTSTPPHRSSKRRAKPRRHGSPCKAQRARQCWRSTSAAFPIAFMPDLPRRGWRS